MSYAYITISLFLALVAFLPAFNVSHWTFRIFDFIRIQLVLVQFILLMICVFVVEKTTITLISELVLSISIIYQIYIIFPYLPFNSNRPEIKNNSISLISVNVLQKNNQYQKLINLVENIKPDILLTLETNKTWEDELEILEESYNFNHKIPKENRYGMHFYTNLKVNKIEEHYLISDETPSIEVHLTDKEGNNFIFWGIHPPPPSPTEKPTAKQKDAELMKVAKLIREVKKPAIITGDFNNVCWSKSANLFSKVSGLIDARLGKGIYGTFPAGPSIFRFPLDLLFHSVEININKIKTLPKIGSDHLPLFSQFSITNSDSESKKMNTNLKSQVNTIIKEGKEAVKNE